jgi:hypothetical protein
MLGPVPSHHGLGNTLKKRVESNVHEQSGVEEALQQPSHSSVEQWLGTPVAEQLDSVCDVLADTRKPLDLMSMLGESPAARSKLIGKSMKRARSSLPEADRSKGAF